MGQVEVNRPTVSVAMCSYNGARFLAAQLDSICRQTVLPAELVIQDDGSTDETSAIVNRFARGASFPVRFLVNAQRLGPARNFEACITRCAGDIVVLTDQDDIWLPDRIERTICAYRDTDVTFTYADAPLIDGHDRPIGRTIFSTVAISGRDRRLLVTGGDLLPIILRYGVLYGATMSITGALAKNAVPFPEGWSHDEWLSLVGSATGRGMPTAPVMHYRQHGAQVVGAGKAGLQAVIAGSQGRRGDHYCSERRRYEAALTTALDRPVLAERLAPQLREKLAFLAKREAIQGGGVAMLIPLLRTIREGSHARFSGGLRSIVKDVYLAARMMLSRKRSNT